jgi:hypothetical protein
MLPGHPSPFGSGNGVPEPFAGAGNSGVADPEAGLNPYPSRTCAGNADGLGSGSFAFWTYAGEPSMPEASASEMPLLRMVDSTREEGVCSLSCRRRKLFERRVLWATWSDCGVLEDEDITT